MSSRKTKRPARRIAAAVGAIGALLMSSGVVLLATAQGADAAPGDKWFVCKYVDTPGEPETLQTGQNPISVSENAIPLDVVTPGASFADGQGRSVVLQLDDTPPGPEGDPGVEACAAPSEDTVIAVDVVFVDPTCDNDNTASLSLTGDTEDVTVEQTAEAAPGVEVTVTATPKDGFMFVGDAPTYSETHTFAEAADCSTPVVEPPVVEPPVVEPPAKTPTIVEAGIVGTATSDVRSEQGMALLASGLLLLVAAAGLARPRGARR